MVCIFILNIFSMQDKKPEAQLKAFILCQFSRSDKSCHNTQTKQPYSNIPIRHIHASCTTWNLNDSLNQAGTSNNGNRRIKE